VLTFVAGAHTAAASTLLFYFDIRDSIFDIRHS